MRYHTTSIFSKNTIRYHTAIKMVSYAANDVVGQEEKKEEHGVLKIEGTKQSNIVKSNEVQEQYGKRQMSCLLTSCPGSGKTRTVLVTGGAGYIGSHTCLEILNTPGYEVVVIDNLVNSSEESLRRVKALATSSGKSHLYFRKCDIRDRDGLQKVFHEFPNIDSCIHFAGLKSIGDSTSDPLTYYDVNVAGTTNLFQVLRKYGVRNVVFSSSATVYGNPDSLPIKESSKLQTTNPYGTTKLQVEQMLRDCYASEPEYWNIFLLRYFNPIGAHSSGMIGEDPYGVPRNLMPYIAQVCVGRREKLTIFGNDYDTSDGTGVRDYIHVVDLARGHVAALQKLYFTTEFIDDDSTINTFCKEINLGTGQGVSVLQLLEGMVKATGKDIPYEIVARRHGDVAELYADVSLSKSFLHWEAELCVEDMCRDVWKWQSLNPHGYRECAEQKE